MQRVHVAPDRWNFELEGSGEFISPVGGNMLDDQHPVAGTLFRRFDAADCDRRFGRMAELGLNCLRQAIGVNELYDPARGLKAEGVRNWDTFLALAEKHGVYLMPVGGYIGGNDWFDIPRLADSGRQLDWDCAFWSAFAGHCAGHPAIWAWDLRNELLYTNRAHGAPAGSGGAEEARIDALLKDRWPQWLEAKYGSLAALNRAYGTRHAAFADVPGSVDFVERPFDLAAADFRHYLNGRGYEWCRRQCEVLRAVDPLHMICSGNNSWLYPGLELWMANGFHNAALHDLFDFTTHHPYPAWECLPTGHGDPLDGGAGLAFWLSACVGMSRANWHGKPLVLQEFGWYGGGASRFVSELPPRSEEAHADYTRALVDALRPHVNGFVNWPTCDMPAANDISNHGGIFTHDGKPKALGAVYRDLAANARGRPQRRAAGTVTLTCSLLGLFTSRAYQDRLWDDVHAAVTAGQVPDFRFV